MFWRKIFAFGSERPESAVLCALALGCLAGCGEFPLWSVVLFFAALSVLFRSEARYYAWVMLFAGLMLSAWQVYDLRCQYPESFPLNSEIPAELVIRVNDPALSELEEFDPPRMVFAEIISCQANGQTVQAENIPTTVYWDRTLGRPVYGGIYQGSGTLSRFAGSNSGFEGYLRARGISRTLSPDKMALISVVPDWRSGLLKIRDFLACYTLSGIQDDDCRNEAAALFWGMTGGMNKDRRRIFNFTGTVHIFSVSGMHVAVVAALLLVVLRYVPRSWRCFGLIFGCGLYVIMSGASAPALRSWWMLVLWALLQWRFYYLKPWSVFCWVGTVLLLTSPLLVLDVGVRFSILVTGILLCSIEWYQVLGNEEALKSVFTRSGGTLVLSGRWAKFENTVWSTLFFCLAAFFGSIGISLHALGQMLPASVLINLLLTPLMPLSYMLLFLRMLLPLDFSSCLLEWCFRLLNGICAEISQTVYNIPAFTPGCWSLLWYYGFVFAFFRFGGKSRYFCLTGTLLVLLFWLCPVGTPQLELAVIGRGDSQQPAVVICDYAHHSAIVVNPGSRDQVSELVRFLRRCAVTEIELVSGNPEIASWKGIRYLPDQIPVRRLRFPENGFSGRFWRTQKFYENTSPWSERDDLSALSAEKVKIIGQKSHLRLEYFDPGSKLTFVLLLDKSNGGWQIDLSGPDISVKEKVFLSGGAEWSYGFK